MLNCNCFLSLFLEAWRQNYQIVDLTSLWRYFHGNNSCKDLNKKFAFLKDWFDTSQGLWMKCCKMKMLLKAGIFWNHQRRLEVPRGWLGLSVVVTKSGTSWDKRHIYPAFETTPYFVNFFEEFAIIVIQCHCNTEEELRIFFCFLKIVYLATNPVGELLEDTRAMSLWNGGSSSPFRRLEGGVGVEVGSWKSGPGLELARHSRGWGTLIFIPQFLGL